MNRVVFSSATDHWSTPIEVFSALHEEFQFIDDPCPLHGSGGLDREWCSPCFVNPPYSEIKAWTRKAFEQSQKGKTIVLLIPSRTDTQWWHDCIMQAQEIRFIRGRLKFGGSKNGAPFPSAVVVYRPD